MAPRANEVSELLERMSIEGWSLRTPREEVQEAGRCVAIEATRKQRVGDAMNTSMLVDDASEMWKTRACSWQTRRQWNGPQEL